MSHAVINWIYSWEGLQIVHSFFTMSTQLNSNALQRSSCCEEVAETHGNCNLNPIESAAVYLQINPITGQG